MLLIEFHGVGGTAAQKHTVVVPKTALSDFQADSVIPRHIPTISETVSHLLGTYEEQARTAVRSRHPQKSGHYNSIEFICTPHELRWPNEGHHPLQERKE